VTDEQVKTDRGSGAPSLLFAELKSIEAEKASEAMKSKKK
jgi:hypothetical protein